MSLPKYFSWNQLYTVINLLGPDHPELHWSDISENPNITEEIVDAHPGWPWDYETMGNNSNMSYEFITAKIHLNYSSYYIINNPRMTWNKIKKFVAPHNYQLFTKNSNMTLKLYDKHKYHENMANNKWHIHRFHLLGNKSVLFDVLIVERDKYYSDFVKIIRNYPKIAEYFKDIAVAINNSSSIKKDYSLNDILTNEEICIRWLTDAYLVFKKIDMDKYDNIEVSIDYKNKYHRFEKNNIYDFMNCIDEFCQAISMNPYIEYKLIKDSLYKWNLCELVRNPALTIAECLEIIHENPDWVRDWGLMNFLIHHPFLTANDVLRNPDLDWEYYYLQHSRYIYNISDNPEYDIGENLGYDIGDNAMVRYNMLNSKDLPILTQDKFNGEIEHYNKKLNQRSIYITWKDIIIKHNNKYNIDNTIDIDNMVWLYCNKFKKDKRFRTSYIVRKYFNKWVTNTVIKRNKVVYECCVHELNMRFRDVENGVI